MSPNESPRKKLESEQWLHLMARLSGQAFEQMRVRILEFLDTDVFHVSPENCIAFLSPLIESWDIDLETFGIEIVLNRNLALGHLKRFDFVEREPERPFEVEPGLEEFLRDPLLSGDATDDEIEFLKSLRFKDRRPLPLYYYRVCKTPETRCTSARRTGLRIANTTPSGRKDISFALRDK